MLLPPFNHVSLTYFTVDTFRFVILLSHSVYNAEGDTFRPKSDCYAEPHDLIHSASLPCRLDHALYCGKKKMDHKDCEDDGNRLVLACQTSYGVSQKVPLSGKTELTTVACYP